LSLLKMGTIFSNRLLNVLSNLLLLIINRTEVNFEVCFKPAFGGINRLDGELVLEAFKGADLFICQ